MDRLILAEKLESLARCVQRVEQKAPDSVEELAANHDLQDILVLNLSRAVQLCVDIGNHLISESPAPAPQSMGGTFTTLADLKIIPAETADRMRRAVGFRNIAVHNYERIDWAIVHAIAVRFLADFRVFADEVSRFALEGSAPSHD